ncbi:MAG: ROK family protein [Edaphobacter sp.]|uniref:ROK family protein n=1 Tax=Edaphobacter sp. TaxID=1934404 RepID=UPI00238C6586|nr:ROK family protein [Edaphobacter sp.]MDE1175821.1 ROK family protein [Edaphobacter sp.]
MTATERLAKPQFRSARNAVIAALLRNKQLARSELSKITGVSPAAITEVTQAFLQRDLLAELPVRTTGRQRGRPTVQLQLQASHAYFLGISIDPSAISMVITDLHGRVIEHMVLPGPDTPERLVAEARTAFNSLLRSIKIPRSRMQGVGITITGIVNADEGICRYSAALGWRDIPVARMLTKALRLPAWVENDANAVAVGEKFFGSARGMESFTSVMLGPTIGSAHFVHGKLYRGYDDSAGEIGHITVVPKGTLCRCGRYGCLDTIAGGYALRMAAEAEGMKITSMRDLEERASRSETRASRLLRAAGNGLGLAVASLVHLNNPQAVLFTDIEGFDNGVFRTAALRAIENNVMPRFLQSTQIIFGKAEENLLARSAASVAAFAYLNSI